MTEQCPNCNKERLDGTDFCICGWHFGGSFVVDPQSEDSFVQSGEEWEQNRKEMEKKPEQSKPQSEHSFVQSEEEWEQNRKEMEKEPDTTLTAEIADNIENQGTLVLPNGKEITFEDNPKTVGRDDVREHMEFELGKNPNEVSSEQFTIWREDNHYFIEDRITSVQKKPSTNGTKVNGETITNEMKRELHNDDKIEFARIPECVATFQIK